MGAHGRQGESWVPKARTTGMRREVKKALGKTTGTRKERKERGEKLSSPSRRQTEDKEHTVPRKHPERTATCESEVERRVRKQMGLESCPQSHQKKNTEQWRERNGRQGDSFDRKHPERRIAMEIEK